MVHLDFLTHQKYIFIQNITSPTNQFQGKYIIFELFQRLCLKTSFWAHKRLYLFIYFFLIIFVYSLEQSEFQWSNSQKSLFRYLQLHIFIMLWWEDHLLVYFLVSVSSLLQRSYQMCFGTTFSKYSMYLFPYLIWIFQGSFLKRKTVRISCSFKQELYICLFFNLHMCIISLDLMMFLGTL